MAAGPVWHQALRQVGGTESDQQGLRERQGDLAVVRRETVLAAHPGGDPEDGADGRVQRDQGGSQPERRQGGHCLAAHPTVQDRDGGPQLSQK